MHRGYTKLWRKLEDSPIVTYGLKPIGLFALFLIKANHESKTWQDEQINSGQFITSINNLSLMACESPKVVRRLLSILSDNGMIKMEIRANKWHKITICNWGTYQSKGNQQGKPRETSGKLIDPLLKNEEKEKNSIYPFDQFWEDYQKKTDRAKTEKKYNTLSESIREKIKTHVPMYVKGTPDPQYRKHATTYLNGECWNDEVYKQKQISDFDKAIG